MTRRSLVAAIIGVFSFARAGTAANEVVKSTSMACYLPEPKPNGKSGLSWNVHTKIDDSGHSCWVIQGSTTDINCYRYLQDVCSTFTGTVVMSAIWLDPDKTTVKFRVIKKWPDKDSK